MKEKEKWWNWESETAIRCPLTAFRCLMPAPSRHPPVIRCRREDIRLTDVQTADIRWAVFSKARGFRHMTAPFRAPFYNAAKRPPPPFEPFESSEPFEPFLFLRYSFPQKTMLSERDDGAPKGHPFLPARPIPYKGQGKRKELLMNQPSLRYRQRKKNS